MSQQNIQLVSIEQAKRVCPIIAGALIMGVVVAGFAMVPFDVFAKPPSGQTISLIMAAMAGVCFLASMIIPNIVSKTILSKFSEEQEKAYPTAYQTQMIIRLALLEGPAFANLVALPSERNPWSLGIVVWLIMTMILFFPTPGRIDAWVKQKKELADFPQQDADFN